MTEKTSEQSIMDKSMRSVFVGNIPYEATEEKLKEIFSEVGPVISLKLVFDRESGKPKGYGFCEYKDQETALSAMRNLNGYEIGGRTLRVDNACTEKSRMEMQQLLQGPQVENPYGDHCDADSAPEVITKTVASLPPEQMYELMKQMKACIQNNPSEARQMLLLNPQLAYALLQAQVVMRIVDPASAVTMLHKSNQMPSILNAALMNSQQTSPIINVPQPVPAPQPVPPVGMPVMGSGGYPGATTTQDVDLRPVDPRLNRSLDQDMRVMGPTPVIGGVPSVGSISNNINTGITTNSIDPIGFQQRNQRPPAVNAPFQSDPRQRPVDPRQNKPPVPSNIQQQQLQQPPPAQQQNRIPAGIPNDASDQEKAALIMQVLQLSDEQIAMLPPEQRASILVLKEQIAKSTQR